MRLCKQKQTLHQLLLSWVYYTFYKNWYWSIILNTKLYHHLMSYLVCFLLLFFSLLLLLFFVCLFFFGGSCLFVCCCCCCCFVFFWGDVCFLFFFFLVCFVFRGRGVWTSFFLSDSHGEKLFSAAFNTRG